MDDDTTSAAWHQIELEDRRAWEEYLAEYNQWLSLQAAWWTYIDSDEHWIKEHQ